MLDWSGVDYSSRLDRGLALGAGRLAIAAATLAVVWRPRMLVLAIVSGVLGLNMAIVNIKDISGHDLSPRSTRRRPSASASMRSSRVARSRSRSGSPDCCRGGTFGAEKAVSS
ncbi:MAG TPA: hypothetical protein VFR38_09630 [Gaiellaceae bacterium]|nr:hypothetical protein [Gaiellaceae bacterium]